MKSSQAHANPPTTRQNRVARCKASRRATPVDLKQKPIQPRTRRHKPPSFESTTPGTQNAFLASFRKTRLNPAGWPPLPCAPTEAYGLKNPQTCKICKIRACPLPSPKPRLGFVPQNEGHPANPHQDLTPTSAPARSLLQPQETGKTVRSVRLEPAHCHPRTPDWLRSAKRRALATSTLSPSL